jgi:serine/threonine-protein kinase
MSPEQLMGHTADGRSDLWGCGVILYELLTGVSPFLAETPAVVMQKVLQSEPPKPTSINAALPPTVRRRGRARAREEGAGSLPERAGIPGGDAGGAAGQDHERHRERMQRSEASRAAGAPPSVRMPLAIAPEDLADIERSLSRHVGPLAPCC